MRVIFEYEVHNRYAEQKSFWKTIDMPSAPTRALVFNDSDFTFQTDREVMYNFEDQSYFVRVVDHCTDTDMYSSTIETLISRGWSEGPVE